MRPVVALLFSFVSVISLGACNSNPLENFVTRNIEIESKNGARVGHLDFRHTEYFHNSRRVCDTVVCGYTNEWRCHTRYRCFAKDRSEVCRGSTQTCTSPDHTRPVERCEAYEDCGYESIPQYCQVNCRDEAFIDSNTTTSTSAIQVKLRDKTGSAAVDDNIKGIWLGVKTNSKFGKAIDDPSQRPSDFADLFNQLKKTDNTLLVLSAKGIRLVSGQSLLKLPAGFKGGDPALVELVVEATGTDKTVTSVLGTAEDFPALESSSGPN